jgi:hypothetical protein
MADLFVPYSRVNRHRMTGVLGAAAIGGLAMFAFAVATIPGAATASGLVRIGRASRR